jgi:hypothetical protein
MLDGLVKVAIAQGGPTLIALLVLLSYRRDYQRLNASQQDKIDILLAVVEKTSAAIERSTSASEAQEAATNRLTHAVERLDERRRAGGAS